MNIVFACLFSLSASAGEVSHLHLASQSYMSGMEALKKIESDDSFKDFKELLPGAKGFVSVPLDYGNPSRTMQLFYRLPKTLDAKKPTVIFINGGPGGTSLGFNIEDRLVDFNVVYFDQRGTGLSRPPTFEDLLNPVYFSSEFIARDIKVLADSLNLEKISLYGHSYGTVIATIFAHLFPERTVAVVLEGTVFDGTPLSAINPDRLQYLNSFFKSLSQEDQKRVVDSSRRGTLLPTWFGSLVKDSLRSGNSVAEFRQRLSNLLQKSDATIQGEIAGDLDKSWQTEESFSWGAYMYYQIGCQELSFGEIFSNGDVIFNDHEELVPDPSNDREICLQIPGMANRMNRTFHSTSYPVAVPISYIQGWGDLSTGKTNAMNHFDNTAKGRAVLIKVAGGGHGAMVNCLSVGKFDPNPPKCENKEAKVQLIEKLLLGGGVSTLEVNKLGSDWSLYRQK